MFFLLDAFFPGKVVVATSFPLRATLKYLEISWSMLPISSLGVTQKTITFDTDVCLILLQTLDPQQRWGTHKKRWPFQPRSFADVIGWVRCLCIYSWDTSSYRYMISSNEDNTSQVNMSANETTSLRTLLICASLMQDFARHVHNLVTNQQQANLPMARAWEKISTH